MKTYRKLLGILSMIFLIIATIFLLYTTITKEGDERVFSIILFIPTYILIHYTVLTRFGFSNSSEKNNKYYLLAGIALLLILFIFPIRLGFQHFRLKKELETQIIQENEIIENRAKLKIWRNDENLTNKITGKLKTKYEQGNIYYQLEIMGLKNSFPSLQTVIIQFEDSDEFITQSIVIPFSDNPNKNFYETSDSLYFYLNSFESFNEIDCDKINDWELLTRNIVN